MDFYLLWKHSTLSVLHLSLQREINIEGDPPLHGNGSAEELAKSESDRIKTFYQTVLSVLVVFIVAALSGYKDIKELYSTTNHKKVHLSNLLVAEGLLLITTFWCAVVLMMFEFFIYQHGRRGRSWYRVVTILIAVTGTMLIVANTVLVIITNRNNTVLSVVLAPVLVLVSVAVRAGAWMEEERSATDATLGSKYDTAMKGTFDMATIGTMASFGLQGTIAFGYLKTPDSNQDKGDPPLDLAVCYATSTISLIMMMICAMPLALLPANMLKNLIEVVENLRHVVLAALAMMALVVSVEFLDGFVVLSVCPEAVALVLYYAVEFFSLEAGGQKLPWLDFVFRIVAAVGFSLMTGLYGAFLGTNNYSVYLKAAMFILLLAVLSSLSRLAIPIDVPEEIGGVVEMGIAGIVVIFPAAALVGAIPLVLKVFLDLYISRGYGMDLAGDSVPELGSLCRQILSFVRKHPPPLSATKLLSASMLIAYWKPVQTYSTTTEGTWKCHHRTKSSL
ncbi:hypothetical protein HU200_004891 [Digitaria exilis]|uniref:Uncharacterized protein n=1 Tax=Digitaria exilis TaxID=1010633 RepID=A0A835FT40_9POAL|nr:hypothetical protein HU200_004891 [Digitaria exilis]